RSRELAALELAWRAEPLSHAVRSEYARRWWDSSRWSARAPLPNDQAAVSRHWLDLNPLEKGEEPGAGALATVEPGHPVHFQVDSSRAPKLARIYVVASKPSSAQTPEKPLNVTVDGHAFPVLALEKLEPVELALPAGEHALSLEA